ncbi:MAG: PAS domain S-box protein [Calditrichaeota bacterium]|nr:PAS domain S-box protein [Calditrichota bacterium]
MARLGQQQTLREKLVLIIVTVAVLSSGMGILLITLHDLRYYRNDFERNVHTLAHVVAENVISELVFEDHEQARITLSHLMSVPYINKVVIFDNQQNVFARFSRAPDDTLVQIPLTTEGSLFKGNTLYLMHTIFLDDKGYGKLYIEANTAYLDRVLTQRMYDFLVVLFIIAILAFFLAFYFQGYISRPILNLSRVLKQISESRDFSKRLKRRSGGEIGELYDGVNHLLDTIQAHEKEIESTLEELKRSESRFRYIFEKSNDAMYVLQNDKFVLINPRFVELFEYTQEETTAPDFNFLKLVAPESIPAIQERYERRMRGETISNQVTFKAVSKSGKKYILTASLSEIEWGGEPAILGVLRDITDQVNLENQLRQAQKMEAIGKLAGGIAHDFNNILTAINGHAQLALLRANQDEATRKDLLEIVKGCDLAAKLTRQLLGFSRKQIVELKVININDVIRNMQKMLRRLISEDIDIQLKLNPDVPPIKADPGQIEQILINLIVNAQDAIQAKKEHQTTDRIIIATDAVFLDKRTFGIHPVERTGWFVVLSVSDTGIGMTEEVKSRIFEPFFTTKKERKGTGLGLSMVYGIVQQNNADIYVYSEPGEGSTFKIYWPAETRAQKADSFSPDRLPSVIRGNETILFVEDDDGVRHFGCEALSSLGYRVIQAANGKEALELFRKHNGKIDILVTDTVMPQMGGKELADRILEMRSDLKVLFASGYTDEQIVHHGVLEEGIFFIQKPYTIEQLAKKIRQVLDGDGHS